MKATGFVVKRQKELDKIKTWVSKPLETLTKEGMKPAELEKFKSALYPYENMFALRKPGDEAIRVYETQSAAHEGWKKDFRIALVTPQVKSKEVQA